MESSTKTTEKKAGDTVQVKRGLDAIVKVGMKIQGKRKGMSRRKYQNTTVVPTSPSPLFRCYGKISKAILETFVALDLV